MPSWPTALGGMLFAGYAANQANKAGIDSPTALVGAALRTLNNDGGYSPSASGRVAGGSELSVLQNEVDRLHKLLSDVVRDKKGGPMVIHAGGPRGGGWTYVLVPCAVVGGAFYVYAKVRGLAITDFFMVTNRSLQQFRELVSQSMTQLWEEVRKQKDEFLARMSGLSQQQQMMMVTQSQMDEKLEGVSTSVEEIRDTSNHIVGRVGELDHTLRIVGGGVQRANEGIYLLCSAVAEVTRRVGMDNSRLKTYVQSTPAELEDYTPGLRTLLADFSSGDQATALGAVPSIKEVPEDSEVSMGPGEGMLTSVSLRSNGNKAAPEETSILYRRESAPVPSARGFSSLWGSTGGANAGGNRSRAVASNSR